MGIQRPVTPIKRCGASLLAASFLLQAALAPTICLAQADRERGAGTPPRVGAKPSVVIVPLEDQTNRTKQQITVITNWDQGTAVSKLLATDLEKSGLFSDVKTETWKELAERKERPDIAISGSFRREVRKSLWWPLILGPQVFLAFFGIPLGRGHLNIELDLTAVDPANPQEPLWHETFNRSTSKVMSLYTQRKVLTRLWHFDNGFLAVFPQVRDSLARALQDGSLRGHEKPAR